MTTPHEESRFGDQLLKPADVAKFLAVHPQTLRRWVREKKLVAVRLSDQTLRYRASDIEALMRGDASEKAAVDSQ